MKNETILEDVKLSKSEKIRRLYDNGNNHSEIAKLLDIRYQFVYNVIQRRKDKQELDNLRKIDSSK